MSEQRFAERVAVVTGAGSGIGQAVARQLAVEGAVVIGCDVDAEGLATTAKLVEEDGHTATMIVVDITASADIDRIVAALPDQRVDLLANVAGVMDHFLPVTELDDATWDRVLAVNLTGPMRLCRALLPLMIARSRGAIVNVSSIGGLTGAVAGSAYVSSKHGLVGLTRSIANLYAEDGIRANAVCPGGVQTNIGRSAAPKVPWAYQRLERSFGRVTRTATPAEIATLICWLGSDEAVNVNGAVVASDGGWTS
ncbi:SDR family NAD(P)-dependent oxidoreductase [Micromonospora polyrhachis]|uniref:NAD(P)-dependent dehydrogenase (Short-subunit alcohol dehydrogenase family) n=1 Tax=Micromonospora polyrhachis TaxID=1282883 RepID=A0A7W7WMG0_9ACTN|nr:SDR family NAD(P)-dependent oxidoreductase [Micromonospora polyrhachis]MBB4956419.1 NAD(P)-dependent dehydrogenase (short-subunit alcohol dehydrogenase family) [Micromonospora polyrhachis]